MTSTADPERAGTPGDAIRAFGALLLGTGLIMLASTDIPAPLPWAYGLLPLALLWLERHVGLLYGTLAATATLGAVYAAGVTEPPQLLFVAVLAASGLLLGLSTRRGARASTALTLAAAPVLLVAVGYLFLGGMEELTKMLAARLEEVRRMETEHRVSQVLGLSAAEFERALGETGKLWTLLLPSLFALKWIVVLGINCWLASILFQARNGFPAFHEFSTWRVHPAGAWALALSLVLIVTRLPAALEAGVNLAFPLAVAYTIQGFAVARFAAIALQIRGVVQVAIVVLIVLMPILLVTFLGIGFFDAWYDFRRRLVLGPDAASGPGSGRDDV
ncbi:MAG: DUF2232 domain-containing protein [Hyphomicrobiales bacterium]